MNKKENYQDLTHKEVLVINFPTNIAGWILDAAVGREESDSKTVKALAYENVFDTWYKRELDSLTNTDGSEFIRIDPSGLDIKSTKFNATNIPVTMTEELLSNIKKELEKEEKARGVLDYNDAVPYVSNMLIQFKQDYRLSSKNFNYESLSFEEINSLVFPPRIDSWIKESRIQGEDSKDDIKAKIKTKLKLVLKNDIKFNLEALIKELKIDMGGITINNDFNFDNDMHFTYNSLDLILKELIKINEKNKEEEEDKPVRRSKKTTSSLLIEGFNVSYLFGTYFEADLNLDLNLTRDSKSTYTFKIDSLGLKNKGGNILKIDEFDLNSVSVSIPKGATKTLRIGFSITYNYNLGQTTIKMVRGGYRVTRKGAEVGIKAGTPFVQGWAKLNYDQTNVGDSQILGILEGSHDMTFTDHYVFELKIENKDDSLDIQSKNISFADKKYTSVCYEEGEMINLGQNIKTVK